MSNTTVEKEVCEQCGVDVRDNTQFCYNCGAVRTAEMPSNGSAADTETQAALDDLSAKFKIDEASDDQKLAQAADQRRKARVVRRKQTQFVWEPADEMSATWILILAILVSAAVGLLVLITIFWR
jgi:hypothetical protein